MKRCPRCGNDKPDEAFARRTAKPHLLNSWCRKCENDRMLVLRQENPQKYASIDADYRSRNREKRRASTKRFHENNPGYVRASALRRGYGITPEVYDALFAYQEGRCAICKTDAPSTHRKFKHFSLDHDHDTGLIRGLLCSNCNTALGLFKDSVESLGRAIAYLARSKT